MNGVFNDLEQLEKWGNGAVTNTESNPEFHWCTFAKSMVELRAGRYQSAIEWVSRHPPKPQGEHLDAARFAIRAIAKLQLGDLNGGTEDCYAAKQIIDKKLPNPAVNRPFDEHFTNWLTAKTLVAEAHQVQSQKTEDNPVGIMFAVDAKWAPAAIAYQKKIANNPADSYGRLQLASIYAVLENRDDYRRICREMQTLYGDSTDPFVCNHCIKACSLWKGELLDVNQLQKWAESAVLSTDADPNSSWFALAKGLTELRVGRSNSAMKWVRQSNLRGLTAPGQTMRYAILALAYDELGNVEEAQAALECAQDLLTREIPKPQENRSFGLEFTDWLVAQVLTNEASQWHQQKPTK